MTPWTRSWLPEQTQKILRLACKTIVDKQNINFNPKHFWTGTRQDFPTCFLRCATELHSTDPVACRPVWSGTVQDKAAKKQKISFWIIINIKSIHRFQDPEEPYIFTKLFSLAFKDNKWHWSELPQESMHQARSRTSQHQYIEVKLIAFYLHFMSRVGYLVQLSYITFVS